jgi:hypothetical protein
VRPRPKATKRPREKGDEPAGSGDAAHNAAAASGGDAAASAAVGAKERVQVVQCDRCGKWRELADVGALPDEWFCELNADREYSSCEVEEQEWSDGE